MAVFTRESESVFIPSEVAAGPWDPNAQHGSAPASLIARAVEKALTNPDMLITRVTIDLMRPVPLQPMTVTTKVLREGRQIQVFEISIEAGGHLCVRGQALAIKKSAEAVPDVADVPAVDYPDPETCTRLPMRFNQGFSQAFEMRNISGMFGTPGGLTNWLHFTMPFVEGEETSPLVRAVATGDFTNGSASAMGPEWTFINADLSIDLIRYPRGEWIALKTRFWASGDGMGMSQGELADSEGVFASSRAHLVLRKLDGGTNGFPNRPG